MNFIFGSLILDCTFYFEGIDSLRDAENISRILEADVQAHRLWAIWNGLQHPLPFFLDK